MRLFLLLVCCSVCTIGHAQSSWQEALNAWLTTEEIEERCGEQLMEQLEELATAKINLNQATRKDLEELPFLSAQQVEGLILYLDRYRPIRSLNELEMVSNLNEATCRLLRHFVYVGEEAKKSVWSDFMKYGHHQLVITGNIPFYKREGDRNGYLGFPYRHDMRYQFNNHHIKTGVTAAQDAGEPFFADRNSSGYDHYSYYLQLRDMGQLEELNIGMYRVQMGMGLVMNTNYRLGKLATLQSLGRSTHTLTAHSSRSSANYLQGAAASIRLSKEWRVTAFASYRSIDATLNDDGTARTLLSSGYHRTISEMGKKNNTHEADCGGSIGWRRGTLHINVNSVFTHLNRQLMPQETLYRKYAAKGNDFINSSIDYGYNNTRWSISGETAINRKGALALTHTVGYKLCDELSVMMLHRYYDKRYTALHAGSFSEGSNTQNEHGIYVGATWIPSRQWNIQGYADYAHFAWPRYQVTGKSDACDGLLAASHTGRRWVVSGRYRVHIRQLNSSDKMRIVNRIDQRMRLGVDCRLTSHLQLCTQIDGMISTKEGKKSEGVMVGEHIRWQREWLRMDIHAAWFHTDDYNSRIYQHESSVQNDFSFPCYYGHGIRYMMMAQANIKKKIMVTAKVGVTNYFDRSSIGSGLQEINQSSQTDLLLQLRYRL